VLDQSHINDLLTHHQENHMNTPHTVTSKQGTCTLTTGNSRCAIEGQFVHFSMKNLHLITLVVENLLGNREIHIPKTEDPKKDEVLSSSPFHRSFLVSAKEISQNVFPCQSKSIDHQTSIKKVDLVSALNRDRVTLFMKTI
jgi:hypothetical protein